MFSRIRFEDNKQDCILFEKLRFKGLLPKWYIARVVFETEKEFWKYRNFLK
jgi:hypothetical protein